MCRFLSSRGEKRDCISIQKGLHLNSVKAYAFFPQNLWGGRGRTLVWTPPLGKKEPQELQQRLSGLDKKSKLWKCWKMLLLEFLDIPLLQA